MRKWSQRDWVAEGWWKMLIFAGICAFLSSQQDAKGTSKDAAGAKMPEFAARDYYDR